MPTTLGNKPFSMNVQLDQDADFVLSLTSSAGNWSQGSTLYLTFPSISVTWQATISADKATWNVDKNVVNAVLSGNPGAALPARLYYANGGTEILLGTGVTRTGP